MAPLPNLAGVYDSYSPPQFVNTHEIVEMHKVNRFSRGSEISLLITGTSDEQKDYIMGLIIFAVCTFVVFAAWTVLLLVLKCCGRKRVGLFSGHPPQKPAPITEDAKNKQSSAQLLVEDTIDDGGGEPSPPPSYVATTAQLEETEGDELSPATAQLEDTLDDEDGEHHAHITTLAKGVFTASAKIVVESQPAENEAEGEPGSLVDQSVLSSNNKSSAMMASQLQEGPIAETNSRTSESDTTITKYKAEVKRVDRLLLWSRIMIVLSGIGIFVSTSVFIAEGIGKLDSTLNAGVAGMQQISGAVLDVVELIDNFTLDQTNLTDSISVLDGTIGEDGLCPNKTAQWVAECVANGTIEGIEIPLEGENCTILETSIKEKIESINQSLEQFLTDTAREVAAIRNDLFEIAEIMENLSQSANSVKWAFYVSSGFAILVDLVVLILLIGTFCAWKKKLSAPFMCMRSFLVVPLFILLIFLVWLFAIIFSFGAVLTADFCFGGPELRLFYIIQKLSDDFDSVTFQAIEYYLTGCAGPTLLLLDAGIVTTVVEGLRFAHALSEAIIGIDLDSYLSICGVDITPLSNFAQALHAQIHIVADATYGLQRFFLCSNIFPLIEGIVFDAICYLGATALRNTYIALLLTLIFSFIFITFRAAWQDDLKAIESKEVVNADDDASLLEGSERRFS